MHTWIGLLFLTGCTLQPGSGCLLPGQTNASAVDVEACAHLSGAAIGSVTATADGSAPLISQHGRHDITLPAGHAGYVGWQQDETADVAVYLDQAIPVHVLDADGQPVPPEETASASDSFGAIKHKSVYHLDTGTYQVKLGPATVSPVGLVIEEQHHEEGDDHGHAH